MAQRSASASDAWIQDNGHLVDEVLSEYRSAQEAVASIGRAKMGRGLTAVIWGLRVYVLFMIVVVAINTIQTLH
jgi:hypothetical protein